MANNIWGQWGNDIVFDFYRSPVVKSFRQSSGFDFAQQQRLFKKNKLQPVGPTLQTVTFTLKLPQIWLLRTETTLLGRIARVSGITAFGGQNATGNPKIDTTLDVSPDEFLNEIKTIANNQDHEPLIVGQKYLGDFVIESIDESIDHYQNGQTRINNVTFNFLEWVE